MKSLNGRKAFMEGYNTHPEKKGWDGRRVKQKRWFFHRPKRRSPRLVSLPGQRPISSQAPAPHFAEWGRFNDCKEVPVGFLGSPGSSSEHPEVPVKTAGKRQSELRGKPAEPRSMVTRPFEEAVRPPFFVGKHPLETNLECCYRFLH